MHLLVKNIQHLHYLWLEFPPVSVSDFKHLFSLQEIQTIAPAKPQAEIPTSQMTGVVHSTDGRSHVQASSAMGKPTGIRNLHSSLEKFMVIVEIKIATLQWKYVHKEIGIVFWPRT